MDGVVHHYRVRARGELSDLWESVVCCCDVCSWRKMVNSEAALRSVRTDQITLLLQ